MKHTLLIITSLMLVVGCSSDPIDGSTLIGKDGLKYAPASDKPYSGVAVWYYENGQKKEEGTYIYGDKDGKWTYWYENGQKERKETYKNGEKKRWTEWYENGQKKSERTGWWDGKYTEWYENGQKKVEEHYKDGEEDGLWTEWDEDGNIISTKTYKNGQKRYEDGREIIPIIPEFVAVEGGTFQMGSNSG
ncbi:MAG: toxin-antitoxin system YwqK family antitoxin, partial [Candidatus Scalindua sp.]|nr:toxin-antitoxin system YwqK family antitoxin [Candidatus Scalindua sp.]